MHLFYVISLLFGHFLVPLYGIFHFTNLTEDQIPHDQLFKTDLHSDEDLKNLILLLTVVLILIVLLPFVIVLMCMTIRIVFASSKTTKGTIFFTRTHMHSCSAERQKECAICRQHISGKC